MSRFARRLARTYERLFDRLRRHAFLLTLAIVVFVGVADPFGVTSGTNTASEQLFYRVMAPQFRQADPTRITVLVLDDASVEMLNPGGGYPMGLGLHGMVLEQVLCRHPKAVFVDFSFRHSRDDDETAELAEAAKMRASDGDCRLLEPDDPALGEVSPVLVGRVEAPNSSCDIAFGETSSSCGNAALADFYRVTRPVTLSGMPDDKRYPLLATTRQDGSEPPAPTPALQLFEIACGDPAFARGCRDRQWFQAKLSGLDAKPAASRPLPALSIQWGMGVDPRRTYCPQIQRTQSWLGRFALSARILASEFLGTLSPWQIGFGEGGWCTTYDTMSVKAFMELTADSERASAYIRDRVVFYGADVTGIPDDLISDILGNVPGVQAHAGALDNLLRFGAGYWHDPPQFLGVSVDNILELVTTIGLILFGEVIRMAHAGERPAMLARLHVPAFLAAAPNFSYMLVALATVLALLLFTTLVLGWAPINLLGMLGLLTLANPAMR